MKLDMDSAWQGILAAAGRRDSSAGDRLNIEAALRNRDALEPAVADMLAYLLPLARSDEPFVIGQIGQSLDGRVCTESGDSHYVNGRAGLVHLHRLRALVDCVLVGVDTVLADRPRLTVRHVPGPDPIRAVLDPRGRAPVDVSPLAPETGAAPTLHLIDAGCIGQLKPAGAHVRRVALPGASPADAPADGVPPHRVLAALEQAGCRRILIEGGPTTLSRFLEAGVLDRLHVLVAPLLIGSGRAGLSLAPVQRLCDARRPPTDVYRLGEDTLFDLAL